MSESSKLILCPYCGHTQPAADRCEECKGLFEPLSRRATQIAMGPWYIRDKNMPFRPGCSYEVLKRQVKAGKIKSTTVLRGPTTRQFWSVARNVPGVAHLLGYCHRCGEKVKPEAESCRECGEVFEEPTERNELGLAFPTATDAAAAQRLLNREVATLGGANAVTADELIVSREAVTAGRASSRNRAVGADLLDEVMGDAGVPTRTGLTDTVARRPDLEKLARIEPEQVAPPEEKRSPAGAGTTLDFAPSDEAASPARQPAPWGKIVLWVLVAVMLIALIVEAVVLLRMTNRQQAAAVDVDPTTTMLRGSTEREDVTANEARLPDTRPAEMLEPNLQTQPAEPDDPDEMPATLPAESQPAEIPAPLPDRPRELTAEEEFAVAKTLEREGKFEAALERLQHIAATTPLSRQPEGLDEALRRVEAEVARAKGPRFFKVED